MISRIKSLIRHIKKKDKYLIPKILRFLYEDPIRLFFKLKPHKGINITEEEWDYLIILDACRYDSFLNYNTIKGKLEKKISAGSHTAEWISKNFDFDKKYKNMIYISSNPHMSAHNIKSVFNGSKIFFHVEEVWNYGWDNELNTVPPSKVTEALIKLDKEFPDKKKIIHYLQPHHPYIGDVKLNFLNKTKTVFDLDKITAELRYGKVNLKKLKKAYDSNLKLVIEEIKNNLLPFLKGKIVITADHGEAFGEKGIYFHPMGIYIKELVQIPWLTLYKEEKKIKEHCASKKKTINSEETKIKERLMQLGYL